MITKTVYSFYAASIQFKGVRTTVFHYQLQFEFSFEVSKKEFKVYEPIFGKYVSDPYVWLMASDKPDKKGTVCIAGRIKGYSDLIEELAKAMKAQGNPNWQHLKVPIPD